ncbi:AAA family ATPase [Oceanibaculum indicum]|uniref:Wobble nucleotide-excising tRNase n=1 Tax=Oceanibaculum indicum TaxID=526216 RepID=A0A420WI76_9PROT|nr:AAA family ATPase [Oceanibaculum indicum]RKQ70615.1 wobble nucleotide-excising tRNase [Oceanibaculum indicum]
MLTKIKKIKDLGVFGDYQAAADLANFGRYNIVYGENGSGKTTLSRLFGCLEAGEHSEYPNLQFTIESLSGPLTKGQKYGRRVRVFNSDFVEASIGRFDGPLQHILILGEENKAISEELKAEIAIRDERLRLIDVNNAAVAKIESDKAKIFSSIAKTIGEATSGSTLRSYRKPDAESAYAKLSGAKALSDDEYNVHRGTVRQEQMPEISPLVIPLWPFSPTEMSIDILEAALGAAERAKALTMRSAQSAVIARLAENHDIALWVEAGVGIHAKHASGRCEFCDQLMPADRLKALADHFSVEDQALKEEIEAERLALDAIIKALSDIMLPDRLTFYSELRKDYGSTLNLVEIELENLKRQLEKVGVVLDEKLTLRTNAYESKATSDTAPLIKALGMIDALISRHNDKTEGFDRVKRAARDAIEAHHLLSIKDDVEELTAKAEKLNAEIKLWRDGGEGLEEKRGIEALSQSISDKQAKVSNAHAGGANLTDLLKQFLGRTELRFESSDDGYFVLRRGKPAKRLSEGEKTAIAFIYFLVQLKDQNFNLGEGIVVIDDPISSLDASAIYQAFAFLKNETQAAKQLFILTHNFEFLKLVINWLRNIKGQGITKSYTMILCAETEQGRFARITSLDKLLLDHATEYHYLFKVLYTFKSDGTILSCYHIPNIARKVLETFLDFHLPSNKSVYQKLEDIKFDPIKKTAIYKFSNDLSHYTGKGFDPALVAETQKNTSYLLEMIKSVAPLHYEGLKNLSEP